MSVYNRKMFKPRNARNALNRSAGITSVQKFHAGGPVGHSHSPTGFRNVTASGQVVPPTGVQTFTTRSGQQYFSPGTASDPYTAGLIDIARRAKEGGIGSLSVLERAQLQAVAGGQQALDATQGVEDYLGDTLASDVVRGGASLLSTGQGMLSSLALSPFMSDSGDTSTVGGRLGSVEPTDKFLSTLNINPAPKSYDDAILRQQRASQIPTPSAPRGMFQGPRQAAGPIPDGELAARQRDIDRAREITAAGGTVDVDSTTGAVSAGPGEEIQQLINAAQLAQEQTERSDRMLIEKAQGVDDGTSEGAFADDSQTETETETATTDDTSSTGSTVEQRTDTDPNAGASITAPKPKPENFDQLVAQAKNANAQAGVPPLASDQDEIDTAAQAGTGSAEDIKAEFLKLLPKYEEDPSIQGLNLAMMGFAIAGGESSNAMKNIADGMKKGLPAFIKSKEKRKAFERETDLLASKYAIQRKEGDRNRGFTKNDYYVTKDFVGPDNQKYTAGQPLKLNDAAFSLMEKQGLTGNLVSGTIYGKMLDNTAAVEKAKASAKPTSYHQKSSKTLDIGGNKIEVYYPTADAPEGTKAFPAGREEGWKSFTGKYTTQLEQLSFGQKSLSTARGILSKGDAVGSAGAFGKALDATKAFVPRSIGERMGLDYDNLSSANELENLNRTLALQLAKPLLQEGGKTISNFERMQVAKALGYSDAAVDSTGTIILGNMNNMFTTQADAENRIALIEGILQRSAEKLHSDYKDTATLFGYELTTPEQAVASAPSGSLGNLEQRDDGKFYFVTGQ